jgi:hypothetical protein
MNYIKRLQTQTRVAGAQLRAADEGIRALLAHLESGKFHCGNTLDGYIHVKDVQNWLQEPVSAIGQALDTMEG